MNATLTFLGTGTSMGVPTLGCGCPVCTSADAHDRRLRPSIAVQWRESSVAERIVVVDTGPDFREQALRAALRRVDAVFYTHAHADHILGMDDLRPLSFVAFREGGPIPLYADADTSAGLERVFDYTFRQRPLTRRAPRCSCGPSAITTKSTGSISSPCHCCTARCGSADTALATLLT